MDRLKIFQSFNLRNMLHEKITLLFIILAFSISSGMLSMTLFFKTNNEAYFMDNIKKINHGDISIKIADAPLNTEQKRLLTELKNKGNIDYDTEISNLALINCKGKNTKITIRFVDFNKFPYYYNSQKNDIGRFNNVVGAAVVSENLSRRLNLNVDDNIKFVEKNFPIKECKIKNIISMGEVNLEWASIYGSIIVDQSCLNKYLSNGVTLLDLQAPKFIYIKTLNGDTGDSILNKLNSVFNDENTKIITKESLKEKNKLLLDKIGILLYIFSLLSFIVTGPGFALLMYLRVLNQRNNYTVLKVLGMTNKISVSLIFLESLILSVISSVLGLLVGYSLFVYVNQIMTGLNTALKVNYSFVITCVKVILISAIIIISHSVIAVNFISNFEPSDILRKRELGLKNNKSLIFISIIITILYISIYSILLNNLNGILIIFLILAAIALLYSIDLMIVKALPANIKIKHYIKIVFKNLTASKVRTAIMITAISICVLFNFIVMQLSFGLKDSLNSFYMDNDDFNMVANINPNYKNEIDSILDSKGFKNYYTMKSMLCDYTQKQKITVQIVNDKISNRSIFKDLSTGVIVSGEFAIKNKLSVGEVISIDVNGNKNLLKINKIEKKYGLTPFNFDIKVLEKNINLDESKISNVNYFFKLSTTEKEDIQNIFDFNKYEAYIMDADSMISNLLEFFKSYLELFKIIGVLFVFSSIFILTNMTIISVKQRIKEFVIYQVYGATRKNIFCIIILENIIIGILGSIMAVIISNLAMKFLIKYMQLFLFKTNYKLSMILVIGTILMVAGVSALIISRTKFKQFKEVLRQE